VEREGTSRGHGDEDVISPPLLEALAGLDAEASEVIGQVIALYREFPAWAVWLPYRGRPWMAVRPASARAPGPDLPMIWVRAGTAAVICPDAGRGRAADPAVTAGREARHRPLPAAAGHGLADADADADDWGPGLLARPRDHRGGRLLAGAGVRP
jgi:hypothetical protein